MMNNYLFENNDIQEFSSGCESGWTVYLEHSSISAYDQEKGTRGAVSAEAKRLKKHLQEEDEEDEDEDLSMVSDASSGPPHLHEEEGYGGNDTNACFYQCPMNGPLSANGFNNKKKKAEHQRRRKVQDQSLLDDTASSPFLGFSNKTRSQPSVVKNALEYSQGYSTTQFEVRQPYQEHYKFFHSAPSGNQMQQKNQWLEGKGW